MPDFKSNVVRRRNYVESWMVQPTDNYAVIGGRAEATGTLALTANVGVFTPVYVDRPIRMTKLAFNVTSAGSGGTLGRVGIFAFDHVARTAGALIKDAGTVAVDATGIRTITVDMELPAGWYLVVLVSDGTPTVRLLNGVGLNAGGVFSVSTTTYLYTAYYTAAQTGVVAGGFAATGPALTAVTSNSDFRTSHAVVAQYAAY